MTATVLASGAEKTAETLHLKEAAKALAPGAKFVGLLLRFRGSSVTLSCFIPILNHISQD